MFRQFRGLRRKQPLLPYLEHHKRIDECDAPFKRTVSSLKDRRCDFVSIHLSSSGSQYNEDDTSGLFANALEPMFRVHAHRDCVASVEPDSLL